MSKILSLLNYVRLIHKSTISPIFMARIEFTVEKSIENEHFSLQLNLNVSFKLKILWLKRQWLSLHGIVACQIRKRGGQLTFPFIVIEQKKAEICYHRPIECCDLVGNRSNSSSKFFMEMCSDFCSLTVRVNVCVCFCCLYTALLLHLWFVCMMRAVFV